MPIESLLVHKKLWLVLAVAWTLLIGILCLVSFKKLPTVKLAEADKYVHAIMHFVFTVLWFGYARRTVSNALFKVVLGSVLYGAAIEVMQSLFTQNRQADLMDAAANTFGAALAALAILFARKYVHKTVN